MPADTAKAFLEGAIKDLERLKASLAVSRAARFLAACW